MIDDNQYVKRVAAGDLNAYRFLVDKYKDKALSVAFRVVKDQDVAEDVVQEAFISAYKHLSNFRQDAQFRTWFMRIVVNEAIKIVRHQKVKLKNEDAIRDSIYEEEINSTFNVLKSSEQQLIIESTFEKMPPREALSLQLFYLEDFNLKEIEEVMRIKASHIKVILHRARKQFYELVEQSFKHEISSIL